MNHSSHTPSFSSLFFCLVALVFWCVVGVQAAEPVTTEASKVLVYSANPQYPPYHWSEDEKTFEGASVELLRLLMPPGLELRPVVFPWKRTLMLTKAGQIDLILSLRVTPERKEYLEFTDHRAFPNPIVVFVHKDRLFRYAGWADLKGRLGGVALGDTFGAGFDEYWPKELQVEVAPTMVENFRKLESGRIAYFISSYYVGLAHLAKNGLEKDIFTIGPPISDQDIHFGFSKLSAHRMLLPEIDRRLEELDRQGVLRRLLDEHIQRCRQSSPAKHAIEQAQPQNPPTDAGK